MGTNNEDKQDKGQFVQFPLHLIYERKDLSRDDKWVLLAIMGKCWSAGPHRLSYREIEALSGVPITLLTSYQDKSGKQHEGTLDRLARLGDIRLSRGKEINTTTGKPRGQTQTYIYMNYERLWQQNIAYRDTKKALSPEPYRVNEGEYEGVSNANTCVSNANTSVCDTNGSVSNANASVSYTNESVCDLPSETTPYITQIDSDITDYLEESNGEHTETDTLASPHVDAHSLEEDEFPFALPDGDYIIIERLPGGGKKIRRASGRPIGELIPIGMDTSGGLQNLITVNALTSSQNNENDSQSSPIADSNTTPSEGDDHAPVPASGHPHRLGDTPGADGDSHDAALEDTAALSPEARPILEAGQEEIDTLGRAWQSVDDEQTASREDVPAVAASPPDTSTVEPGYGGRDTVPGAPVPGQETPPAQGTDEKPKTPAPLSEPEMGGKWSDELCVQYAEWCNDKRYTDNMRAKQLNAAKAIHKDDKDLTLADFKQAYDERNDEWWQEHKKKLHVADMKAKGKSGIDRVHEMLQHIEDRATQGNRSKRHLRIVPTNAQPDDANMIEWKGQWMPKEEAYQQGYLGGWERYKGQLLPDGRHPLDDELPMQGMK